ncbi:hypothetical protein Agub_g7559, partial [Astrephomene gubernaculifera]
QRYFLTQIREWFVECGPEGQVAINIRTDVSLYRLLRPLDRYAPWYRLVCRCAHVAAQVLAWLEGQQRAAKLGFGEVVARLAALPQGHRAHVGSKAAVVERFIVVHGQVILNMIQRHWKPAVRQCGFGKELRTRLAQRRHIKLKQRRAAGGAR